VAEDFHELCIELTPRQRIAYEFRTSASVDFNIHFHTGDKVDYPLLRKGLRSLASSFTPTRPDHYCLMWENKTAKPVRLEYSYVIGRALRREKP
jgi:hypothetical protein